jgi:hypothetical protein
MQALIFDTTILQNGMIQIPELSDWLDFEVYVIVVIKSKKNRIKNEKIKYNGKKNLIDFHKIRKINTGLAEILTLEKAININEEIAGISRQKRFSLCFLRKSRC